MNEKWFDVGTTIIPRNLTTLGIGSFLKCMDRSGYKLRWVVNLDTVPGLEHNWDENLKQIEDLAKEFDDALIMTSSENLGYGKGVHKVMSKLKHDTLWIEDDWNWLYPFKLSDVEKNARDGFYFRRPYVRAGNTSPSFWKLYLIKYLLEHWPEQPTERKFAKILTRAGFKNNNRRDGIPKYICVDIGRQAMADEGFKQNLQGKDLTEYFNKDTGDN